MGKKFTQVASEPQTGQFTYTPGGKTFTFFADDIEDGTEIVAFFDVETTATKISNDSETYSKVLNLYVDATAQDNCDNAYHVQIHIPRADFSGEFELTMGGDPSVHAIEVESLAGGCTGSTNLWDFIVFQ